MDELATRSKANCLQKYSDCILCTWNYLAFFGIAIHFIFLILSIIFFGIGWSWWRRRTTWDIGARGGGDMLLGFYKTCDSGLQGSQ